METTRLEKTGPEAQAIQYADILDTIGELPRDADFSLVFLKECRSILKTLKKGNNLLYHKTVEDVQGKIRALHTGH